MSPKYLVFVVGLLGFGFRGYAQLNNAVFEDRMTIEEPDTGKLYLGVNMLGFFRNNEYFDTVVEGFTLIGYQFNPFASYTISRHVRLDGGIYLQKDFGNEDISTIAPTLSLKIKKKDFGLIFGNLESSLNHRLIEPLYDFERVLNNRLETGVQFQVTKPGTFIDMWLDWQNMIYNKDSEQEKFVAGLSLSKRVINSVVEMSVPVQITVGHRGGQINVGSPPLETVFNSAVGLEISKKYSGWLTTWKVNGFHAYYKNVSTTVERPYIDGYGAFFNASVSTAFGLDLMTSYWYGHEFQSVQGDKRYPSVSVFDPSMQEETMRLLFLRFLYDREIGKGVFASARVEPYYDFTNESLQYSYGLYLQFRDRFFLTQRK